MSNIDFEEDQTKMLGKTENIQSLADQVEKLNTLDQEVEILEKNLKQKKKDFEYLSGEVIPTMMAEMGLSQLKLMDGSLIDVKPNYSANITIANRDAAFNWLRTNGLGDIIKNEISVSLVATRITRQLIMLLLQQSVGINRHKS
jgi:septin family protein